MEFLSSFWSTFLHFLLWPLYFLQQENYDLPRFWKAFPASLIPKNPRQKLVWTPKLWLIFILSFELFTAFLMLIFYNFFQNDVNVIIFYLHNFGNGVDFGNLVDLFWYFGYLWFLILPFVILFFPVFQSLFYTITVLLILPIDNFCKNQITQKAAQKVQKWRNNELN